MEIEIFNSEEEGVNRISYSASCNTSNLTSILKKLISDDPKIIYQDILDDIIKTIMINNESTYANITFFSSEKEILKIRCYRCYFESEQRIWKIKDDTIKKESENLDTLAVFREKCIISNDTHNDPRRNSEIIKNHPQINKMISVPICESSDCVGQIILANKLEGYEQYDVYDIMKYTNVIYKLYQKKDVKVNALDVQNEINMTKDRFLASMSHELRTPLNGIVGMSSVLSSSTNLTNKQKEYIKVLQECSFQLMNLMNNILDFSKLASNRFSLVNKPISLREVIKKSTDIFTETLENKKINFNVNVDDKIPISLNGDEQRLIQILNNLLSNSLKFTKKGSIKVKVEGQKIKTENTSWHLIFTVEDTGIGIDPEFIERIWDVYKQCPNENVRDQNVGTGLGLSIVKELVKLMGGDIKIYSEGLGKGTTAMFDIYLEERVDVEYMINNNIDILKGKEIMIVDDRIEMRMQMSKYAFDWKLKPISISSGEECLHYLSLSDDCSKLSCILVDIHMPNMNGIELAKILREKHPHIKLIAVSSVDNVDEKELFNYFIYKPLSEQKLFPSVFKCLKQMEKPFTPSSTSIKKKKIKKQKSKAQFLIVEDDSNNSYTLREYLENIGIKPTQITQVDNGKEAVNLIKNNKFDIVFMDIVMPVMDGYEATRIVKGYASPPIILAVSAAARSTDKSKAMECGFDGYVTKPIVKSKLVKEINRFVKLNK